MKYLVLLTILFAVSFVFVPSQSQVVPYEKTYVPYTENYNVRFNGDGKIDYDLLIEKIMPEIFEKKLLSQGVDISSKDIILQHGPQVSMYVPSSYVCGYVVDYKDKQVYWLQAAINSTDIQFTKISTETPTPKNIYGNDSSNEWNLGWCFGPLKEQVASLFLKEKSYLTLEEEELIAAGVKHELRGNPNLNHQEFRVGKFNFDYGSDVLAFCGEFQKPMAGLGYFGGVLKNGNLQDIHLDSNLSPLCAISEDAKIFPVLQSDVTPKEGLEEWKNIRMETVHLNPASVEKLLHRNYMSTENVNYMIFEYSTSLNIVFIDFMPDDSNTIWNFEPINQDTFFKIRVPKNGANYYMPYGPDEWYKGDLKSVTIQVDGVKVDTKTEHYVRSPEAPYPQHYTDYIFKVPSQSSSINIVLDIEHYQPEKTDEPRAGYRPMKIQ